MLSLLLEADLLWLGQMWNGCLLYSYMEADAFMLHQTILCSVLLSPKCSFKHILHIFLIGNLFCLCPFTPSWPTLLQKTTLRLGLIPLCISLVSFRLTNCSHLQRCLQVCSPFIFCSFLLIILRSALQHCEYAAC